MRTVGTVDRTVRFFSFAFLLGFLAALMPSALASVNYEAIDLTEQLGLSSQPLAINRSGQITGVRSSNGERAFRWDPVSGATDLALLDGGLYSRGNAINDAGQVAGYITFTGGIWRPCLWGTDGMPYDLGTLGGLEGSANGINNAGQVVGTANTASGNQHAFLWDGQNPLRDLNNSGDDRTSGAVAINNTGLVTGFIYVIDLASEYPVPHVFLWDAEHGMVVLGAPPGALVTQVSDINDDGQIVGFYYFFDDNAVQPRYEVRAFLWEAGSGFQDLNPFPGTWTAYAYGINNRGQIAGYSDSGVFLRACLWGTDLAPVDVGALVGDVYSTATTINDAGQIAGYAYTEFGVMPFLLVPDNLPPSVTPPDNQDAVEGTPLSVDLGAFTDPGSESPWSVAVNWGDGSAETFPKAGTDGSLGVQNHTFADNGVYEVTVTVTDEDGASGTTSFMVHVKNAAPLVEITGPASGTVAPVNKLLSFSGRLTDPGTRDTHTGEWTFAQDGATIATVPASVGRVDGQLVLTSGNGFDKPGVYTFSLSAKDKDDAVSTADSVGGLPAYVVIYDPSEGFVTGGGWLNSPAGAFSADPTLSGRASFGFVARYRKGASTPDGHAEFHLHAARLTFRSTTIEWLVVAGSRAQMKGTGVVNGGGDYGYLLTAVDGQVSGGGQDRLRLKVWNRATGALVYDNLTGSPDSAELDNGTELGGGGIVIHAQ